MALREYKGSARSTYSTVALSGSDMLIQTEGLTGWPDGQTGPFFAVINRQKSNEEKVLCESQNGSDLIILQRGADETAPQNHAVGSIVEHVITATDAREANEHVNDTNLHIQNGNPTDRPTDNLFPGQMYYETDTKILWIYGADAIWHASTAHPRLEESLDMQGQYRVINLVDPVDAQDAATKSWVESTAGDITAGDAALARDWAIKMDGPVADGEYSSKYHATDAKADASNAADSATAAGQAQAAAEAAAANAINAWKDFEARYLGAHPSPPMQDGQGEPLQAGALYYDTTQENMFVYDGSVWIAASSASVQTITTYEFLASDGQTDFSGTDLNGLTLQFDSNNVQVFLNGVLMSPGDDYTTSAGTVTLLEPASVNDVLNVVAFVGFVVADHYTKAETDVQIASLESKDSEQDAAISANASDITNRVINDGGVVRIRSLTQAEYDAIETPSSTTLYVVTD